MRSFADIHAIAADRKGGADALEVLLADPGYFGRAEPLSPQALAATEESRWLAEMARAVFQAGFSWKVIAAKWDGFEAAFDGFDPGRVAFYHDEEMDRLLSDKGVVRNGAKLQSVVDNARWINRLSDAHGSAGAFFGSWPDEDLAGLLQVMTKDGSRLGGNTGQRMLRAMGRDSYMLSQDVVARLVAEGVVDKAPTSQRAMKAVQGAFNDWREESGRSLTAISRVLAMSV